MTDEVRLRLPEDFEALRRRIWFVDCLLLGALAALIVHAVLPSGT